MILLDTRAVLWLGAGRAPAPSVEAALEAARGEDGILLSPITAWELARKERKRPGALGLREPPLALFRRAAALPGVRVVPLTPEILVASVGIEGLATEDPIDRMIVATALAHDALLLTADARMLAYAPLRTLDYGRPRTTR